MNAPSTTRVFVARIVLIALLGLPVAPENADAQVQGKVYRIGYLTSSSIASGLGQPARDAFRDALRELGWVEGKNVVVDYRFAEGNFERLPDFAAEFVRGGVDVIVATPTPAAVAAKKATGSIPIVMASVGDPVAVGLVATLARPGGNVTGVSYTGGPEIFGKQLQLLTEAVPKVRRVAVLLNPGNPGHAHFARNVTEAARALGVSVQVAEARAPGEFEGAFAAMTKERAEALLVVPDSMFGIHRERLAQLATRHRLPSIFGFSGYVEEGGLMSYGPNLPFQLRQAAGYVDKILRGSRPADLPVEQPTRFELAVNLKAAKALGLKMPESLVQRADIVVE